LAIVLALGSWAGRRSGGLELFDPLTATVANRRQLAGKVKMPKG
jgi:hypothetical protein